jgi:hypothetical protein
MFPDNQELQGLPSSNGDVTNDSLQKAIEILHENNKLILQTGSGKKKGSKKAKAKKKGGKKTKRKMYTKKKKGISKKHIKLKVKKNTRRKSSY